MADFDLTLLLQNYSSLVSGHYREAIEALMENKDTHTPPRIDIPDASVEDAAQHVQDCAHYYAQVSLLSAFARSAQKLAEGQHKHQFRQALLETKASNRESREAEAGVKTKDAYDQLIFFESALALFSSMESAARTAADSSRKIAELIHSQRITESGNKY